MPVAFARLLALLLLFSRSALAASDFVWWEAEKPSAGTFPRTESSARFSSGKAILHPGGDPLPPGETAWVEYQVEVPADGDWHLYARKFWKHGPFRWRFDDAPWREITRDVALLDGGDLNWIYAGRLPLKAGVHTLRVERTDNRGPAQFDCFVLAAGPFTPRGDLRPDESWPAPPAGWTTFDAPAGAPDRGLVSLRGLNENVAGEKGPVTVRDGRFVQAGKPLRFVAIGVSADTTALPGPLADRQAALLAGHGVNLVRYHSPLVSGRAPEPFAIDPVRLDRLHRYVAACKAQGIYTHLSFYFPLWFRPAGAPGGEGYVGDKIPFALLHFNDAWRSGYREMWREALSRKNPYTGLPLAADPAVLSLELVNEDSVFFWTFDEKRIPPPVFTEIERAFTAAAIARHGSLEKAFAAWGDRLPRDGAGHAQLPPLYSWFSSRGPRQQDAVRFLAEHQRRAYADDIRFMREECGFRGLVVTSNWTTANAAYLGALDLWTNTAGDFLDSHGYYVTWRKRVTTGFEMRAGDLFADRSLIRWESRDKPGAVDAFPSFNMLAVKTEGFPQMVSEFSWTGYNARRAEMPLLAFTLAA